MSQCEGPDCSHSSHKEIGTETISAPEEKRPPMKTFVDNAGRPVDPDEVRPVKPIDLQTPQQLLAKAEEKLKEADAKIVVLEAKVADAVADAKTAVDLAASIQRDLDKQKKRNTEFAGERETWKRRAEIAEARPTPDHIANIVADRDRLRGEVAAKDKRIAQLDQAVGRLNDNVAAAVRAQRQAELHAQKIQETFETMQRARDAAQKRELDAVGSAYDLDLKLKKAQEDLRAEIALRVAREQREKKAATAAPAVVSR